MTMIQPTFSARLVLYLLCISLVLGQDMGSDFQGYMEEKEKQEEIYAKHQDMLDKHEVRQRRRTNAPLM